jgi:Holliday junction resolvasome RuvABC endonuclease subunit
MARPAVKPKAISVLGIDTGTLQSGYVVYLQGGGILAHGILPNHEIRELVKQSDADVLAMEEFVSYGSVVGQETMESIKWNGRFQECWPCPDEVIYVTRMAVKKHVCGTGRAKDPQVREGLIKLLGPQGVKANQGPTYGIKSHEWSALAVAITALDAMG